MAETSFYGQISANRRNSFLMAAFVVALLAVLGLTIGYAVSGLPEGALGVTLVAVGLGGASGAFTYFAGDSLLLAVSQAREVDETKAPKLLNVVRELSLAANPTLVARLTGADPARVRAVARVASSPSELPPPRELLAELASVMNLEARIER